jgi:hypothetical protein
MPLTRLRRPPINAAFARTGNRNVSKEQRAMTGLQWVMIGALVLLIVVWVVIRKRQAS